MCTAQGVSSETDIWKHCQHCGAYSTMTHQPMVQGQPVQSLSPPILILKGYYTLSQAWHLDLCPWPGWLCLQR